MPKLVQMSVVELMKKWRPGSQHEEWTWNDEYVYCWAEDGPRTRRIIEQVETRGIDFDSKENPILLGNDGRVWDGHHRILIALYLGHQFVNVEIIPQYYGRYEARYQEEQKVRERQLRHGDWHAPVDLIIWEHVYFRNDIPFHGDSKPLKEKKDA